MLMLGPNLAAGQPFRLSSTFSGWAGCVANNGCSGLMFHTETENNPWVEIDLGAPKKVRRVEVVNRGDCCADRATPLVAEVSTDRVTWTQVARARRTVRHLEGELPGAGRALRAAARRPPHGAAPAGDRRPLTRARCAGSGAVRLPARTSSAARSSSAATTRNASSSAR